MGYRIGTVVSTTIANALPANANETVVCISPGIVPPADNVQFVILWYVNVLSGTGTTIINYNERRGTLITGVSVNAQIMGFTTVAGNFDARGGILVDTPGIVSGQQYCITCAQTGATAAGTLRDVSLFVMVL